MVKKGGKSLFFVFFWGGGGGGKRLNGKFKKSGKEVADGRSWQ